MSIALGAVFDALSQASGGSAELDRAATIKVLQRVGKETGQFTIVTPAGGGIESARLVSMDGDNASVEALADAVAERIAARNPTVSRGIAKAGFIRSVGQWVSSHKLLTALGAAVALFTVIELIGPQWSPLHLVGLRKKAGELPPASF